MVTFTNHQTRNPNCNERQRAESSHHENGRAANDSPPEPAPTSGSSPSWLAVGATATIVVVLQFLPAMYYWWFPFDIGASQVIWPIGGLLIWVIEAGLCCGLASLVSTSRWDRPFSTKTAGHVFVFAAAAKAVISGLAGMLTAIVCEWSRSAHGDAWPFVLGVYAPISALLLLGLSNVLALVGREEKTHAELVHEAEQKLRRQNERRLQKEAEWRVKYERARSSQLMTARQKVLQKYLALKSHIETELPLARVKALIELELPDDCCSIPTRLASLLTTIDKHYQRAVTRHAYQANRGDIDRTEFDRQEFIAHFETLLSMDRPLAEIEAGAKQLTTFLNELAKQGKQVAMDRANEAAKVRQAKEAESQNRNQLEIGRRELREWFLMSAAEDGWPNSTADLERHLKVKIPDFLPVSKLPAVQAEARNYFLRRHFVKRAKRRYSELQPLIGDKYTESMFFQLLSLHPAADAVQKKADEVLAKLEAMAQRVRERKQTEEAKERAARERQEAIRHDEQLKRAQRERICQQVEAEADETSTAEEKLADVESRFAKWTRIPGNGLRLSHASY